MKSEVKTQAIATAILEMNVLIVAVLLSQLVAVMDCHIDQPTSNQFSCINLAATAQAEDIVDDCATTNVSTIL